MNGCAAARVDRVWVEAQIVRMATRIRHDDSPRSETTVSLPSATLAAAKDLGIDVSAACEAGLAGAVKAEHERRWIEENREAMEAWNRWYETHGDPLAHLQLP